MVLLKQMNPGLVDVATIVFGPTQYGKSSFIACLLQADDYDSCFSESNITSYNMQSMPAVGRGDRNSVTRACQTYWTDSIGFIQDTPGYNDTEFADIDIEGQTALELTKHPNVRQVRFLVFESLQESSIQLRATLAKFIECFGNEATKAVVVIASKLDRADPDELEGSLRTMKDTMDDLGISSSNLVLWKKMNCNTEEYDDQIRNLKHILFSTSPVCTKNLKDIQERVKARAKELCDKQEPVKSKVLIDTEEQYMVERKESVPYEDTEWKHVCISKGHKMVIHKNHAAGVALYTATLGIAGAIDGMIALTNPDQYKWVEKKVTQYREETRFDLKTRKITKEVEIENKRPVSDFYEEARSQIITEIKAALSINKASSKEK